MSQNGVIETATGDLLRCGFADFENDGTFDGGTESYRTDVPVPANTRNCRDDDDKYHQWDGDAWQLVSLSLGNQKSDKITAIDVQTMVLIAGGYTYDAKQFSLSALAQVSLVGLHSRAQANAGLAYPIHVSTIADEDYSLADLAAIEGLYNAAFDRVRVIKEAGTSLKQDINDAADQAVLDAVVDNRA